MLDLRDYDALTFDCYGTLIDWEAGLIPILTGWAKQHGIPSDAEDLLSSYGDAEAQAERERPTLLYPEILKLVHRAMSKRFGVADDSRAEEVLANSVGDWPVFPDTQDALRRLRSFYKLAILSNVDRASFARTNVRLGVTFDLVVTAQDVGSYKPSHRNFHMVLDKLAEIGVERSRVLHVAQSLYHDHQPARELGLKSVWINRRHGKPGSGATIHPELPIAVDLEFQSMKQFADAAEQAFQSPRDARR
jgi:2-haloacid dehalogenase